MTLPKPLYWSMFQLYLNHWTDARGVEARTSDATNCAPYCKKKKVTQSITIVTLIWGATDAREYIYVYTYMYVYIRIYVCMHPYIHTYVCIHTYTHTYIHTYSIYTYTYIHAYYKIGSFRVRTCWRPVTGLGFSFRFIQRSSIRFRFSCTCWTPVTVLWIALV
jgi:hypothetical protein